jgi:extracellular elastinolytic metalloproteinase
VPVQENSLLDGFKNLVDPADLAASPKGWNNDGSTTT